MGEFFCKRFGARCTAQCGDCKYRPESRDIEDIQVLIHSKEVDKEDPNQTPLTNGNRRK